MTKRNKQRAGLQKKVSSVFKGVSVPGAEASEESSRIPPDCNAGSPNVKQGDRLPLYAPKAEKRPRTEVLAGQTNQQDTDAPRPSISTDAKIHQSPPVEKPVPCEESEGIAASEPTATCSPAVSTEPKAQKSYSPEIPDQNDKAADESLGKRITDPARPVSRNRQTARSSLMKTLAQSEESEDATGCSPSISTERGIIQGLTKQSDLVEEPTEQATPREEAGSKSPASTVRQSSQSPLMKKLAQSEEPAAEAGPTRATGPQPSLSTNRQTSQKQKTKTVRQPEAPVTAKAQAKHPLADSLEDNNEGGFLLQIKEKLIPSDEGGGRAKDKVMVMLVPILAIVMVFMFRQVLYKPSTKAKGAEKNDKTAAVAVKSSDNIEWRIPDPIPAMTRDPLKLPEPESPDNADQGTKAGPEQQTVITDTSGTLGEVKSIVYSDERATALVGNQIVCVGSKINGATVTRIDRHSVEFERDGKTWVQKLRD